MYVCTKYDMFYCNNSLFLFQTSTSGGYTGLKQHLDTVGVHILRLTLTTYVRPVGSKISFMISRPLDRVHSKLSLNSLTTIIDTQHTYLCYKADFNKPIDQFSNNTSIILLHCFESRMDQNSPKGKPIF